MKKYLVFFAVSFLVITGFGQNEKYFAAMKEKVSATETAVSVASLKELGAGFERIGKAEQIEWLPYYYAALAYTNAGYMVAMEKAGVAEEIDPFADKAEGLIAAAEKLNNENAEIFIIKKMIASLRLRADPMGRYMQYGPLAQKALAMAKKLDPQNPRIFLLEAEDQFYTPEEFGGSKAKAKELLIEAIKKYETYKPASGIAPGWGKERAQMLLKQIK